MTGGIPAPPVIHKPKLSSSPMNLPVLLLDGQTPRRNISDFIHDLSEADLLKLQAAIEQLLEPVAPPPIETSPKHEAQGWFEFVYKTKGDKRYGPYRYYRWYQDGKKKSRYVGKAIVTSSAHP
jgi:hypothetical protein